MPFADKIIIGNNTYNLVETTDHQKDCRRRCAFRFRCFNPRYAAEMEVRISTGEVVRTRAKPCEVIARLAQGPHAIKRKYVFLLRKKNDT